MLTGQNSFIALAAILTGVSGVAALHASWRKRLQSKRVVVLSGWLLIALSFWFWIRFGGAEFGPVLAFLQLPMVAWLFVLANRDVRRNNGRGQEPVRLDLPRFRRIARHAAVFLVAVPLAACSGVLVVLAASRLLPWSTVDRLALVVLAVPVVWGVFAYWASADTRVLRPAQGLLAGGSLGAAYLYL